MQEARLGEEREVDGIGQAHVGQIGLRFAAAFERAIDLGHGDDDDRPRRARSQHS